MNRSRYYIEEAVTVYVEAGELIVKLPSGEPLPCVIDVSVDNPLDDFNSVTVKMHCNIAQNDEDLERQKEAHKRYSEFIKQLKQ